MFRIAALDDEHKWIEAMKKISQDFFLPDEYEFCSYTNAERFLFDIEEEEYDIILLDMELPGTSGLEIGRKVRLNQPETTIIFVTNYVEYAVEGYEVNAFRYIPKMMLTEKLPKAYAMLMKNMQMKEKRYFIIKNHSKLEKIPEEHIFYMMKDKKYVNVVHKNGESKVRMTLDEAYNKISDRDFVQIDRSYIVGLKHIMSLENHQVKLRDGTLLAVSRPQLANVKKRIVEYWSKKC